MVTYIVTYIVIDSWNEPKFLLIPAEIFFVETFMVSTFYLADCFSLKQALGRSYFKKETLAHVFSCEFCEFSKNTFLHRSSLVAASVFVSTLTLFATNTLLVLYFPQCVKNVLIRRFFWYVFSRFRTEYGEIRSISPYSVRMRKNTDQKKFCFLTLFMQCLL